MTIQPVVPFKTGKETDVKEFLLPNDGFVEILDMAPFRGRLEKKGGYLYLGRLVTATIDEALPDAEGATYDTTLSNNDLSPGSLVITATTTVPSIITFTDNSDGTLISTQGTVGNTINYLTGEVHLEFDPSVPASTTMLASYDTYNNLPVMGLPTRELATINEEQFLSFDTRKSNSYNDVDARFVDETFYKSTGLPFSWSGDDTDFFWGSNYQAAFFVTNNVEGNQFFVITGITGASSAVISYTGADVFENGDIVSITNVISVGAFAINGLTGTVTSHGSGTVTVNINTSSGFTYSSGGILTSITRTIDGDGVRWFDGTGWVNFQPPLTANPDGSSVTCLLGALMCVPYKGRFIFLNTTEGDTSTSKTYLQRVRYSSAVKTIFYNNLVPQGQAATFYDPNTWRSDIPGNGGFIDAATQEAIVGCSFIKDTLVIFFERSSWQLRFTFDPATPFIFEKINTELGCESTFSTVPFDRGIYAFGNRGIITCDSVNVTRIDQKIPDTIFSVLSNQEALKRVQGTRDYEKQFVYWTYPDNTQLSAFQKFPNRVLVYNYLEGSYAKYRDSFTCFGSYNTFTDKRWRDVKQPWETQNYAWNASSVSKNTPSVVAGNQQGFVVVLNENGSLNDISLRITNASQTLPCIITSPDHNLENNSFIKITNISGMTELNDRIFRVENSTQNMFSLYEIDSNGMPVAVDASAYSAYLYGGNISTFINVLLQSKAFSPYLGEGLQTRCNTVDYLVSGGPNTEFSIAMTVNQNFNTGVQTLPAPAGYSTPQDKVWFRVYPYVTSQFVTFNIFFSDVQMSNESLSQTDFTLHVLSPYFGPAGRMVYGQYL